MHSDSGEPKSETKTNLNAPNHKKCVRGNKSARSLPETVVAASSQTRLMISQLMCKPSHPCRLALAQALPEHPRPVLHQNQNAVSEMRLRKRFQSGCWLPPRSSCAAALAAQLQSCEKEMDSLHMLLRHHRPVAPSPPPDPDPPTPHKRPRQHCLRRAARNEEELSGGPEKCNLRGRVVVWRCGYANRHVYGGASVHICRDTGLPATQRSWPGPASLCTTVASVMTMLGMRRNTSGPKRSCDGDVHVHRWRYSPPSRCSDPLISVVCLRSGYRPHTLNHFTKTWRQRSAQV